MILNLFSSLLALIALIFSPLEAAMAISSDSSSQRAAGTSAEQPSSTMEFLSSNVAPNPLADAFVPDSATRMDDFNTFDATRGVWVATTDGIGSLSLNFTPNNDYELDENGEPVDHSVLDHDPLLYITAGCESFESLAWFENYGLVIGGWAPVDETCAGDSDINRNNAVEDFRIKSLLSSKPHVFVEGDVMWLATKTQVIRFERVTE